MLAFRDPLPPRAAPLSLPSTQQYGSHGWLAAADEPNAQRRHSAATRPRGSPKRSTITASKSVPSAATQLPGRVRKASAK